MPTGDGESSGPFENLCAAWNVLLPAPGLHYCAEMAAVNASNCYTMRVDACSVTTSSSTGVVTLSGADSVENGESVVLVSG